MAPRDEPAYPHAVDGIFSDASTAHAHELTADEFVWLLGSLASFHQIAFEPALLLNRFVAPHTRAQVEQALQELGLETQVLEGRDLSSSHRAVAALGWLRDKPHPALITALDHEHLQLFLPGAAPEPEPITHHELAQRLSGPLLITHPKVPEPASDTADTPKRFGFRWFVPELLKHKRIWREVLLASAAIQLLALGMPLMTQAIIDKVVVHRTQSTLIALGIGLALFAVFSAIFGWIRQRLILHTGVRIDAVLASSVFNHLVQLPPRYFQQRPTGVIAARLQGVESIRDFLASAAVSLVLDLPFLSICLAIMLSYSVSLTLMVLGILGLIVGASVVVAPLFQTRLNREFMLGARNQGFMTEYIAGMDTVKSLQMEPVLQRRFGDYQAAYLQAGFETRQVANTYNTVASALEQTMSLLILIVGAWIVMQPPASPEQVFTIGMLVAFQMFASKLSQPLMRLVGLWQQFQQARLSVQRLGDLMDTPAEPYRLLPTRAQRRDAAHSALIDIQQLAFRYADDRPYLYENLNLSIRAGECVALMGPSGCGKSTLARLLQGFYAPTRGAIVIDGIDTRYLSANELRSHFGVVPQETVLFSGTVLDNLLAANPRATFDEVAAVCRMAEIHSVIEQLPQGYQTEIGERGAGLSGGQRQRIAIARALLKRPRVLIFDEATSNLDQATAESFAHTVEQLRGEVAILFITHAPIGTLRFDRVIRLGQTQPSNPESSPLQGEANLESPPLQGEVDIESPPLQGKVDIESPPLQGEG